MLAIAIGCMGDYPTPDETVPFTPPSLANDYNPKPCGNITGQVVWQGELPTIAPLQGGIRNSDGSFQWKEMPAAYTPQIAPKSKGIADVLVSLEGIDLDHSKPWDIPAANVAIQDYSIAIEQGERNASRVGIVHVGDMVKFSSQDEELHMLRGRGAAFFTLPFTPNSRPITKTFSHPGTVEVSSGIGYIWMAAQLHVVEHPYYAVTDQQGRFSIKNVPSGIYTISYMMPSWKVADVAREPDTGLILRNLYAEPVLHTESVSVKPNVAIESHTKFQLSDFPSHPLP